jgi:myogenesis-regulating glycosidase
LLQIINLGTDFGERNAIEVKQVKNDEWIVRSSSSDDEILFNIESDDEDFSSIYVQRSFKRKSAIVTDCLSLKSQNWYGGPEQMDQRYPIQKFNFSNYAYITKELESAAIMERYWFSSNGFFILLDYQNPLFIDQNGEAFKDQICFTGKKALPYDIHTDGFVFNYRIGAGSNTKVTHLNVINKFLGKPTGQPDERLIKYPIWNTWVRYGNSVNSLPPI